LSDLKAWLASASALMMRVILARTRDWVCGSVVRTLIFKSACSGIMSSASPARMEPTVTTARSEGSTSRDGVVCKRMMVLAASTMGSMHRCG